MNYYIFDLMINYMKLELDKDYSLLDLQFLVTSNFKKDLDTVSAMSLLCLNKVIKDMKENNIKNIVFKKKTIKLDLRTNIIFYPFFGAVDNPILIVETYDLLDIEINLLNKLRWSKNFVLKDYEDFENYLKKED